jgi:hypothetical protein
MDIMPVHARRTLLADGWEFFCQCPRCEAFGDDTRRHHCIDSACKKGHHLVHQPFLNLVDDALQVATLTPCSVCGNQPSSRDAEHVLQQEAQLVDELARINDLIDSGRFVTEGIDTIPLIMRLRAPHPHHYLASKAR